MRVADSDLTGLMKTYEWAVEDVEGQVGALLKSIEGKYPTIALASVFDLYARLLHEDFVNGVPDVHRNIARALWKKVRRKNAETIEGLKRMGGA